MTEEVELMERLADKLLKWAGDHLFLKESDRDTKDQLDNYANKPFEKNLNEYGARQVRLLCVIGGDDFNRAVEWLKWHVPELGRDVDKRRDQILREYDAIFDNLLHCNSYKLAKASVLAEGYAEELAKSLLNIARLARQREEAQSGLTDTESNILEALGTDTLHGPELLKSAGYDDSSHYRQILSNLVKRGVLGRNEKGYYAKNPEGPSGCQ